VYKKKPCFAFQASQGERGEDRACLNAVRHKLLARKCVHKKSPALLFKLRRANVEKIGLASTQFGINFSPENVYKKKPCFALQASQGERGEDRARTDDLLTASQAL
jgi:hypothetical protein